MAHVDASWLRRGYFVLRNEGLMREVRDILQSSLHLPHGAMHIRMNPAEPGKWKHICWWREGRKAYAEAQFFAEISKGYPVLSLGIAIEKGYDAPSKAKVKSKRWTPPGSGMG
jgi:hypothetical protein